MDYPEAVAYLESLVDYERELPSAQARRWNTERIARVLEALGNPHQALPVVHVAGTKGKGSTCALIASLLDAAGYRVGLFTSPHLVSPRERICIDGKPIPAPELASLVSRLRPHLQAVQGPGGPPSFFEAYAALAFLYFAQSRVQAAVIETGLGGRLDATNVVAPLVSVITRISYDHMAELGSSLEEIAAEKAGIIKPGVSVVSSPQLQPVWQVLREAAARQHAPLHGVRDLPAPPRTAERWAEAWVEVALGRPRSAVVVLRHAGLDGISFDLKGLRREYRDLHCPLIGEHQVTNAATAITAVELLPPSLEVPAAAIREGLARVRWPGRLDIVSRHPWIVLDGAHDAASAVALRRAVSLFAPERVLLILGISRDKDVEAIGRELCPLAHTTIFTAARTPRAASPQELQQRLGSWCRQAQAAPDVAAALEQARPLAGTRDLVLVTGSLYLVGEALQALGKAEPD